MSNITPGGRLADDGKRSYALDVVLALLLGEKFLKGEGSGEGRVKNCARPEAGGFYFCAFRRGETLGFEK